MRSDNRIVMIVCSCKRMVGRL